MYFVVVMGLVITIDIVSCRVEGRENHAKCTSSPVDSNIWGEDKVWLLVYRP